MLLNSPVIAGFVRTPFDFAGKGKLASVRPDDLAAVVLRELIQRAGIDPGQIEDVLLGCGYPEASQGNNIARIALLLAGLPQSVPGATINRFCGSSMTAIHFAAGQIAAGAGEIFLCGGVESMSMVPQGGLTFSPNPALAEAYIAMGQTAENVAEQCNVSRLAQEEFALFSHQKALTAVARGSLAEEIVAVDTACGAINTDGCLRQTTLEKMAALKTVFRAEPQGTVTAATSSPLTDGAAGVIVCSEAYARRNRLDILAHIIAFASAGVDPALMGLGPVPASLKALQRADLNINDIDIIEINEAFSSQAIACIEQLELDINRVNLDGGALAIGHPLGATGARITGKAAQLLRRQGKQYALATQCVGGGQGVATILKTP